MELIKQKTIAGRTYYYTTEEELREIARQALVRVEADLENCRSKMKHLNEKRETFRFVINAIQVFPWLGKLLGFKVEEPLLFNELARPVLAEPIKLSSLGAEIVDKRLLSVSELSRYLSMPVATIYTYVHLGRIPASAVVRVGRSLRFEKTGIDKWVNAQRPAS